MTETNPAAFKHWFDVERVVSLGQRLASGPHRFDRAGFVSDASEGLLEMELKDRVRHIAAALHAHGPGDVPKTLEHIVAVLPPPREEAEGVTEGFGLWPLCQYVEEYAVDYCEESLPALRELTRRFSSEFAIRPFIERYPKRVFTELHTWAKDPDQHVRRLVSEGSRPRLPWGKRLRALQADPGPMIPLLDQLREDPELYVRRSVANHLNDISKDHPQLAIDIGERWLDVSDSDESRWVVKHAFRGLVKAGHPRALAVLGFGEPQCEASGPHLSTDTLEMGQDLSIELEVRSTADHMQPLLVDYVVHHQKKNGKTTPKVFKWKSFELAPGATKLLKKKHRVRPITTRVYYPGEHRVEVQINGVTVGETATFELSMPA